MSLNCFVLYIKIVHVIEHVHIVHKDMYISLICFEYGPQA
jgi:hypothetical protein